MKIGYTNGDPQQRLSVLKTGNEGKLLLLATKLGTKEEEEALQARFVDDRLSGEWFKESPELLRYVFELPPVSPVEHEITRKRAPPPKNSRIEVRLESRLKQLSVVKAEKEGRTLGKAVRELLRRYIAS